VEEIKNRPRKVVGYFTPAEESQEQLSGDDYLICCNLTENLGTEHGF